MMEADPDPSHTHTLLPQTPPTQAAAAATKVLRCASPELQCDRKSRAKNPSCLCQVVVGW